MKLYLKNLSTDELIDATNKIIVSSDWIIQQEIESDVFKRMHSDVSFKLSNMDNYFSNLFFNVTDRWEVKCVSDKGRILFLGEIDYDSIEFSIDEKILSITAFSKTKLFWEWAKINKINMNKDWLWYASDCYLLLTTVLERNLLKEYNPNVDSLLYTGIQIDDNYLMARIRRTWEPCSAYTTIQPAPPTGCYRTLNPDTTIEELLNDFAKNFNMEIYIDPETSLLIISNRLKPNNNNVKEISDIIKGNIIINANNTKLYDAIKCEYEIQPPPTPKAAYYNTVKVVGVISYIPATYQGEVYIGCTVTFSNDKESPLSYVMLAQGSAKNPINYKNAAIIGAKFCPYEGDLADDVIWYNIYLGHRSQYYFNTQEIVWHLLVRFSGNLPNEYQYEKYLNMSLMSGYVLVPPSWCYDDLTQEWLEHDVPNSVTAMDVYYSYNNNRWEISATGDGFSKVFELTSNLRFGTFDTAQKSFQDFSPDPKFAVQFYETERNKIAIASRFSDLVINTPVLKCKLMDTDIQINDVLHFERLNLPINKRFLVRSASIDCFAKSTEIKAVGI